MDNKVYAIKCSNYEQSGEKLAQLFGIMGGITRFSTSGEAVALKVNLLRKATPEEAVSPHPALVAAVAGMLTEAGANPVIVDSPGAGFKFSKKVLESIYDETGMSQAAELSGAVLNFDTTFEAVSYPEGNLIKRFEVITPVLKADSVFNLCKLKTHSFMCMTGAVKNNFGVIPGLSKPGYHAKLRDTDRFADMLLDLAALVSPKLSIMDGVVAMEGDGPGTGDPRPVGVILAGTSPLALDVLAGEIIGLPQDRNPVLTAAERRGLAPHRMDQVELIGADISELRVPDFKLPPTIYGGTGMSGHLSWWQRFLEPMFKNGMSLRPRVAKDKCIACGACVKACPVEAVSLSDGGRRPYAHIDDDTCIRCYCCHEMCAEEAIALKGSLMYRILNS